MAYSATCIRTGTTCPPPTTPAPTTTTTAAPTTTTAIPCTGRCSYICNAANTWVASGNNCSLGCEGCPAPMEGGCTPYSTYEVPCVATTTTTTTGAPCSGVCGFICEFSGGNYVWTNFYNSGCDSPCGCFEPATACNEGMLANELPGTCA
jgi:hypothetical protein